MAKTVLKYGFIVWLAAAGVQAQAQAPAGVESAPLSAPPQAQPIAPVTPLPAPASPPVSMESPSAPPPAAEAPPVLPSASPAASVPPAAPPRPTLIPTPGDTVNVDEVVLPAKPAALISGTATWDDGFKTLTQIFKTIESELAKAGIAPAGRPITLFIDTDDLKFRYEAMIPIAQIPEGKTQLTPQIRFGTSPGGKALRFFHKAPYDDIDSTYETITAYLDAKGVTAKDSFIEEYVTDFTDSSDPNLEINIFVQPK